MINLSIVMRTGHGRDEKCVQNLDEKSQGTRPFERPGSICVSNVKMHPKEISSGL